MSVVWRSGCLLVLLAAQLGALNPTKPHTLQRRGVVQLEVFSV